MLKNLAKLIDLNKYKLLVNKPSLPLDLNLITEEEYLVYTVNEEEETKLKSSSAKQKLAEILQLNIEKIVQNSRETNLNTIFFALKGRQNDGLIFAPNARENGCQFMISHAYSEDGPSWQLIVREPSYKMGEILRRFYQAEDKPESKPECKLIGITGTDGKTSTSRILAQLLMNNYAKNEVLSIGTIGIYQGEEKVENTKYSTPPCEQLHAYINKYQNRGAKYFVLEASSQALEQKRTAGLNFDYAIMTHIAQDHLDIHGNIENYIRAKAFFFPHFKKEQKQY